MVQHFVNDSLGCNSVSWAPFNAIGSQLGENGTARRVVTGSCDNTVRIWKCCGDDRWVPEPCDPSKHSGKLIERFHEYSQQSQLFSYLIFIL